MGYQFFFGIAAVGMMEGDPMVDQDGNETAEAVVTGSDSESADQVTSDASEGASEAPAVVSDEPSEGSEDADAAPSVAEVKAEARDAAEAAERRAVADRAPVSGPDELELFDCATHEGGQMERRLDRKVKWVCDKAPFPGDCRPVPGE